MIFEKRLDAFEGQVPQKVNRGRLRELPVPVLNPVQGRENRGQAVGGSLRKNPFELSGDPHRLPDEL
jgi:hypothetical protein